MPSDRKAGVFFCEAPDLFDASVMGGAFRYDALTNVPACDAIEGLTPTTMNFFDAAITTPLHALFGAASPVVGATKPRGRIFLTRLMAVPFFAGLLVADDRWATGSEVEKVMIFFGFAAVAVAMIGRLWCTLYIGGRKTSRLITEGPYSLCRNPLYFFSALGVVGLASASAMASVVVFVSAVFAIYYPKVIGREEVTLRSVHGAAFADYCEKTPRFWPSWRAFNEAEVGEFRPAFLYKAVRDVSCFAVVLAVVAGIHYAHDANILPVFIHLP